jgi:dTDP-4-dehydrorhamnose 3,5-epimerase
VEDVELMRFTETPLASAYVVDIEPLEDERGMFARTWSPEEFSEHGLDARLAACNVSANPASGTLRGLHYQASPHEEAKLIRCTAGAIYDVIVDLRPGSQTFCHWFAQELTARNHAAVFAPPGFAHGFQTLEPDSEVLYLMSAPYVPESARGVRWDDPAFAIDWPPAERRVIGERDRTYPDFTPELHA